jgi:hypothetical protein
MEQHGTGQNECIKGVSKEQNETKLNWNNVHAGEEGVKRFGETICFDLLLTLG